MDILGKIYHINFLEYAHWFMSIRVSNMKDHFISIDQARHATSIVAKYLDTATVKASKKFYNTTFPYDKIFKKADASTSDEKVKKLTRDFNIHYRTCIWSLIYLLYTRADLSFSVYKLAKFSSNPGKVNVEGLLHLLRYIRENKTLGLKYHADMNDAPVSDLVIQAVINTENQLMALYDSSWKDCTDTGRSTVAYIILYQGGPIYHGTHIPGPVDQSSSESEYNAACTSGMVLSNFRILVNEFLKKDADIVPEEALLIILDRKSAVFMDKNGKNTKKRRHICKGVVPDPDGILISILMC